MGIDAKGRNFSAPRLTPGRRHELMAYGSPTMIKDQDRQIAVMNDRARRFGYNMSAASIAKYGGVTARALGTSEGYSQPPASVRTMRTVSPAGTQRGAASVIKTIVIIFLLFNFMPFFIAIIAAIIDFMNNL